MMKIQGLQETRDKLYALEGKAEKKVIRKGLRAGAKITLAEAKSDAPVRSGTIRSNLKVRAGSSRKGKISVTVGVGAKDFKGEAFYASFVLYGHFVGSRKLGDKRSYVKPDNFLLRAYEATKEAAVEKTTDTWKELLDA